MVTICGKEFAVPTPKRRADPDKPRKLRHGHTLLNDIDYRIKRSRLLTLMVIGYRGADLVKMYTHLFGKPPRKRHLPHQLDVQE